MRISIAFLIGLFSISASAFTVVGSLKEVKIGQFRTAIPVKVVESREAHVYVVDLKQSNHLVECAEGKFELYPATSEQVEGYATFRVKVLECRSR